MVTLTYKKGPNIDLMREKELGPLSGGSASVC